jgi:hypothetical protein
MKKIYSTFLVVAIFNFSFAQLTSWQSFTDSIPTLSSPRACDLNNDGILDDQEKAKLSDDKLLNNPGISAWRKKKLRDYLDGNTKSYF